MGAGASHVHLGGVTVRFEDNVAGGGCVSDAREIHQIEYRWHPVRDLFPVASSMSPESTRGWDNRIRSWVRHPSADDSAGPDHPTQSTCYQILPPNGAVAALAWRNRVQQPSERADGSRGKPLVTRVLVGNTSLLTPEVAIALCRMGLPACAGPRPGQVVAGAELPTITAAELDALVREAVLWLDREAAEAAGLPEVIAAALADPNAPLGVHLPGTAIVRPPGEGQQSPLLWGLWRITRPLLGTVRRGWSFSTFEMPSGTGDPTALPDIVFRADSPGKADGAGAPRRSRRELKAVPGDYGLLAGSSQAWLAEWLVAEYQQGGGAAVERLFAGCGVEQPLQARLAAVYDLLHAKWARTAMPVVMAAGRGPEAEPGPEREAGSRATAEAGYEPDPGRWPAAEPAPGLAGEAGLAPEPELASGWDPGPSPAPETESAAAPRPGGRLAAGAGQLGAFPREGTAPPLPLRDRDAGSRRLEPAADEPPPRAYEPEAGRSMPDLLRRLTTTEDEGEFKLLLQDVLTVGGEPDLGNRVEARRVLFEARWCTGPSRPASCLLHADELARIFQVIVIPDLDRPRLAREIADWAAVAPAAVISGLLGAGRGEIDRDRSWAEKYQAVMMLLQPALAQRWVAENGLAADWDPSLVARTRRMGRGADLGRGFLGFRKRG